MSFRVIGETYPPRCSKSCFSIFQAMIVGFKIFAVCGLDAVLGDPRWFPHPVRLMGMIAYWYEETTLRWVQGKIGRYVVGMVLALGLPTLCYVIAEWVIQTTSQLHAFAGDVVWILLGYSTLAARDLADHANHVYRALQAGSLEEARNAVSMIVGRDTEHLSEPEVIRATIETVAESTSDGVIAPLMYLAIGGPALALAYKAVNTLDSMIGHRTEKYQYFGWASARCDDVLNWIPARISGLGLILAAGFVKGTGVHAWKIFRRDGGKHMSPNSGWPEAAMAGALRVQLGGTNYYHKTPVTRQLIGEKVHSLVPSQISQSIRLMIVAYSIAGSLFVGILLL